MITHAILAYAFKLEAVDATVLNEKAMTHYTTCMQHLIPLLNDPAIELSDDVLATVLLLRKYEEFEGGPRRENVPRNTHRSLEIQNMQRTQLRRQAVAKHAEQREDGKVAVESNGR